MPSNDQKPEQTTVDNAVFNLSHLSSVGERLRQRLTFTTTSYMKQPIQDGFNWSEAFAGIEPGEWYLVVFRSRHSANANEDMLNNYDRQALAAAQATPGYVFYFGGTPAADHSCLSFCIWANATQARAATSHGAHRAATELAPTSYDTFLLERHIVRNTADGQVLFLPYAHAVPAHQAT